MQVKKEVEEEITEVFKSDMMVYYTSTYEEVL